MPSRSPYECFMCPRDIDSAEQSHAQAENGVPGECSHQELTNNSELMVGTVARGVSCRAGYRGPASYTFAPIGGETLSSTAIPNSLPARAPALVPISQRGFLLVEAPKHGPFVYSVSDRRVDCFCPFPLSLAFVCSVGRSAPLPKMTLLLPVYQWKSWRERIR